VSTSQDICVGDALPAVFLNRQHVMAKPTQLLDDRKGKILIGVQLHPGSLHESFLAFFILPDSTVDFSCIGTSVFPGCF
jgi:hypothetical protein